MQGSPQRCKKKEEFLGRLFALTELHFQLISERIDGHGVKGEELKKEAAEIRVSWKALKAELVGHRAEHGC